MHSVASRHTVWTMKATEYLRLYARSSLGALNAAGALAIGVVATRALGPLAGIGLGLAGGIVIAALALLSGLGPRFAVAERERALARAAAAGLEGIKRQVMRLASMRVPDECVAEAMQLVALKAAAYASSRTRSGSLDPVADHAVGECVELVDLYLKELDDQSTERRYGAEDNDAVPDAKSRVVKALRERAELLDRAALALEGDTPREDQLSIKEQL